MKAQKPKAKKIKTHSSMPSRDEILEFIANSSHPVGKREIGRHFGLKGAAKIALKQELRAMARDGVMKRAPRRKYGDALPPVAVLNIIGPDADGDLIAKPQDWEGEGEAPLILMRPRKNDVDVGKGDHILARIDKLDGDDIYGYKARPIKKIAQNTSRLMAVINISPNEIRAVPVDKKSRNEYRIAKSDLNNAEAGELVEIEPQKGRAAGLPFAKVITRLGDPTEPKAISLIAIHEQGIPVEFPSDALDEAMKSKPAPLGKREDLRSMPLVTIDPADARDHDDALYAMADDDPQNPGGHIVWVAIADVAYYVRPNTALDQAGQERGNSCYFPDRVVPMLPDVLSGDLCSLHEGVDRPCMALRITLDANGKKISHRFARAIMKSFASLTYEQAQAADNGELDEATAPLLDTVIKPLFNAYRAAAKARDKRAPLDLDLPERQIKLSDDGKVASVDFRARFEAHRLVEEFMVLANVCAAETLEAKKRDLIYRVHEQPNAEKIEGLITFLTGLGISFTKGQQPTPKLLNMALAQGRKTEHTEAVNIAVLRSMMQAHYTPDNQGHFGLNLAKYAHFTSPIRRYADLLVHRALISAHGWEESKPTDGQTPTEISALVETATHISMTERRAMVAERDTTDRYLAAYMSEQGDTEFRAKISGVARFGMFVKLDETGAEGLVPASSIGDEYFIHDEDRRALVGERSGIVLRDGLPITVRLIEATPVSGGMVFELLSAEGAEQLSSGQRRKIKRPPSKGGGGSRADKHKRRRKQR